MLPPFAQLLHLPIVNRGECHALAVNVLSRNAGRGTRKQHFVSRFGSRRNGNCTTWLPKLAVMDCIALTRRNLDALCQQPILSLHAHYLSAANMWPKRGVTGAMTPWLLRRTSGTHMCTQSVQLFLVLTFVLDTCRYPNCEQR